MPKRLSIHHLSRLGVSALVLVAAQFILAPARAVAQTSSPGQIAPDNQDSDNRPALQSMQTVGGAANRPGVDVQGTMAASGANALRAGPAAGVSGPGGLVAASQARDCRAQNEAMARRGVAQGQRDSVMQTCEADQNATAVLPGARSTLTAPAGATGQCKDGSYTDTIKRTAACDGHGGLSHWL